MSQMLTCSLEHANIVTCSLERGHIVTCSLERGNIVTCSLERANIATCSLERAVGWHANGPEVGTGLHVVLLELCQDVFAVRVLA